MPRERRLGPYRLLAELGHGGMAEVFLAAVEGPLGSGFSKLAVVKRLRPHLAEDPTFVAMLLDEARVTVQLTHPNVVHLLGAQQCDGEYFLAMEYLEGQSLERLAARLVARREDRLPLHVALLIVTDVLAGLHHAHELRDYNGVPFGIVHRDVSPQNVFITYDGAVKVLDFGIAKAVGRSSETRHGVVKGKLRYMSPEQALVRDVDRRADVFAAGIMLFELVTGTRFWAHPDDRVVGASLKSGAYAVSPRAVDPALSEEIDRICKKALAHDPAERYATAESMRKELDEILGSDTTDARTKLTSMMKKHFARERERVRAVLAKADLGKRPSITTLAKATAKPPATDKAPSEPPQNTFESPTPRARELAERAGRTEEPAHEREVPSRRVLTAAMLIAVVAFGIALGVRAPLDGSAGGAPSSRDRAVVAPDLVGLASESRQRSYEASAAAPSASVSVAPPASPASSPAVVREPPAPSPAPEARPPSTTSGRPRPGIDNADPWSPSR